MATKGHSMPFEYYSENWEQATEKFVKMTVLSGYDISYVRPKDSKYDIYFTKIGDGPRKVVINSGIHGIEGYFGSAAQLMFMDKFVPNLSPDILKRYTIALIHVINGWGMENRMREVLDNNGGLVDLNRNFGVDFADKDKLPKNSLYRLSHNLLVSKPDAVNKKNAIKKFYYTHRTDGVWDAISRGQYEFPDGLFYGGAAPASENIATMQIYDDIMNTGATPDMLVSVGLHTGLGRFDRRGGTTTANLLVSHPDEDKHSQWFKRYLGLPGMPIQTGGALLGDLVDCLEARYNVAGGVYTADLEVGTGEYPIMSPIYKRMDMGDARYDLAHYGKINPQTRQNLTESWYPSSPVWRHAAMTRAHMFWWTLTRNYMEKE